MADGSVRDTIWSDLCQDAFNARILFGKKCGKATSNTRLVLHSVFVPLFPSKWLQCIETSKNIIYQTMHIKNVPVLMRFRSIKANQKPKREWMSFMRLRGCKCVGYVSHHYYVNVMMSLGTDWKFSGFHEDSFERSRLVFARFRRYVVRIHSLIHLNSWKEPQTFNYERAICGLYLLKWTQ